MTGRLRRALVLAIVVGLVAQSAVAPAMAAPEDDGAFGDECGRTFTELTVDVLTGSLSASAKCEAQDLVANATAADLYVSALAQKDLRNAGLTPIENHVEDSRTFARTIAKTEAVKAFNNGSSKAETKSIVNESVEDYYTTMQLNLAETHRANVNQLLYLYNIVVNSTSYDENTFVSHDEFATADGKWPSNDFFTRASGVELSVEQRGYTMLNGTNETVAALNVSEGYYYLSPFFRGTPTTNSNKKYENYYINNPNTSGGTGDSVIIDSTTHEIAYYHGGYVQTNWKIENASADVKVNAEQYVDALYSTYNQSEGVPVDEVLDPLTLTAQWNTDYNSTGYHGWVAAELGLTGLEGNVNSSFEIAYTPRVNHTPQQFALNGSSTEYAFVDGVESNMSGTLYTDWKPASTNGSFQKGATYDTANANTAVLFIEQVDANSSRVVTLNGTFTIDSMTNVQTGESVNETTLDEQNQQTWNASSTEEEITNLTEYRQKVIENYETSSTGGGGSVDVGSSGLLDGLLDDLRNWFDTALTGAWVGLIALAGAGLLILRILSG
jgi:hypothetical protein